MNISVEIHQLTRDVSQTRNNDINPPPPPTNNNHIKINGCGYARHDLERWGYYC